MSIQQLQAELRRATGAVRPKRRRRIRVGELTAVWLVAVTLYVLAAAVATFWLDVHDQEAMRRAVDIWQVWEGESPTPAAVNAEYPPLQTFLALIPAALPPLRAAGFATNLISAAAGATAITWLYAALRRLQLPLSWRIAATAATALHPMMLLYAATGTGEMLYAALILGAASALLSWQRAQLVTQLIQMGFFLGLAFMVRYEAVLPALVLLAALYVGGVRDRLPATRRNAALITAGLPVVFVIGLWMWINFLSFGDLFRFTEVLIPAAPDLALTSGPIDRVVLLTGDPFGVAIYLLRQAATLAPLWIAALLAAVWHTARRGSWLSAGLAAYSVSLLLGPGITYLRGEGYAPLRDLLPIIPLAPLLLAVAVQDLRPRRGWIVGAGAAGLLTLGVAAALVGALAMSAPDRADEWEAETIAALREVRPARGWDEARQVAAALPAVPAPHQILADDLVAFAVIYFSQRPRDFFTPSEDRYEPALAVPYGKRAFLLIQEPTARGARDTVTQTYPTLYYQGAAGFELDRSIDAAGWRLYRIADRNPNI